MVFLYRVLEVGVLKLFKKVIRVIANRPYNSHTTSIFKELEYSKLLTYAKFSYISYTIEIEITYCPHTFKLSSSFSPCMETTTIICGIHVLDF